jgi:hypothetical protein
MPGVGTWSVRNTQNFNGNRMHWAEKAWHAHCVDVCIAPSRTSSFSAAVHIQTKIDTGGPSPMSGKLMLRLPWRVDRVFLSADFEDSERIWSLSVEHGLRVHLVRLGRTEAPNKFITVAESRVSEEELRSIRNQDDDPAVVTRRIFDSLLESASELPSEEGVSFLRWRLCEAIKSLRACADGPELSFG